MNLEYPWLVVRKKEIEDEQKHDYKIAGPLCFAGDILYDKITAKKISVGDVFVMKNVGANTISMWSKHCSRKKPKFVFLKNT